MQDQDIVRIPLYARNGLVRAYAVIDAVDEHMVGGQLWRLKSDGYACRYFRIDGRLIGLLMHRLLLGLPAESDGREGDHINRDRLDNRRANLRIVTHAGNMQNRPSHRGATSAHRGVYWDASMGKWRGQVKVRGKKYCVGDFTNELEAAEATRKARSRLLPLATD